MPAYSRRTQQDPLMAFLRFSQARGVWLRDEVDFQIVKHCLYLHSGDVHNLTQASFIKNVKSSITVVSKRSNYHQQVKLAHEYVTGPNLLESIEKFITVNNKGIENIKELLIPKEQFINNAKQFAATAAELLKRHLPTVLLFGIAAALARFSGRARDESPA